MELHRCCPTDQAIRLKSEEQLERELGDLPKEENLKENARILRALSHPLRLKVALHSSRGITAFASLSSSLGENGISSLIISQ